MSVAVDVMIIFSNRYNLPRRQDNNTKLMNTHVQNRLQEQVPSTCVENRVKIIRFRIMFQLYRNHYEYELQSYIQMQQFPYFHSINSFIFQLWSSPITGLHPSQLSINTVSWFISKFQIFSLVLRPIAAWNGFCKGDRMMVIIKNTDLTPANTITSLIFSRLVITLV